MTVSKKHVLEGFGVKRSLASIGAFASLTGVGLAQQSYTIEVVANASVNANGALVIDAANGPLAVPRGLYIKIDDTYYLDQSYYNGLNAAIQQSITGSSLPWSTAAGLGAAGAGAAGFVLLGGDNDGNSGGSGSTPTSNTGTVTSVDSGSSTVDGVTNNNLVTVSGVQSSWQFSIDGGTTWVVGTGNSFSLADGTYPAGTIQVKFVADDGTESIQTFNSADWVVDTVAAALAAPTMPADDGTNTSDGVSVSNTVAVDLTALETGATWEYSTDGGTTWTTGMGSNFNLPDGTYAAGSVQVRQLDLAGNYSPAVGNASAITVDTTAPNQTVSIVSITNNTGPTADFITSDTNGLDIGLALSAALGTGELIEYSIDGGATWLTTSVSGSGTSYTIANAAITVSTTLQVRLTDAAGNSGTPASQAITIDTTAPTTTVAIASITNDTGTANDFITSDNNGLDVGLTLSAALGTGEFIEWSIDGGTNWLSTLVTGSGTSYTVSNAPITASAIFEVRVADGAGLNGPVAIQSIVIDALAPTAVVSIVSITNDTETAGDFITSDNNGLDVALSLTAPLGTGEFIEYSIDGGTTWLTTSISGSGTSYTIANAPITTSTTLEVRVSDPAGNSSATASQAITIDAVAPSAVVSIVSITNDTGTAGDFTTSDNNGLDVTLSLTAPLDTGEFIEWTIDGGTTWLTSSVSGTGTSYTIANAPITASAILEVRVSDPAGNSSTTDSQVITIDTLAPTAVVSIVSITNDTGTAGDFVTSDNNGLDVTLSLTAPLGTGEFIEYSIDGGLNWLTTSVSGTGTSYTIANAPITTSATLQVRVTDTAGNSSAQDSQAITIDASTSTAVVSIVSITNDTGTAGDFITSDSNGLDVALSLTAPLGTGEFIEWSIDGGTTWLTTLLSGTGTSYTIANAPITTSLTLEVRVTDAAGNSSPPASAPITIDTLAPTAVVSIVSITNDTGTAGDFITSDSNGLDVALSLTAPLGTGEFIEYSIDGGANWLTASVSGTGTSYTIANAAITSSTTLQVRVTDAAGNSSTEDSQAITIDTVDPTAVVSIVSITNDTGISGDFVTSDMNGLDVALSLTAPLGTGEFIEYSINGGLNWLTASVSGTGTSYSIANVPIIASATLQVRVTDTAGNSSTTASQAITIDTVIPAAAVSIVSITDDTGTGGDFITSDSNGLDVALSLTVPLGTGEFIEYSIDGGVSWLTTSVSGSGTSYTIANAPITTSLTLQVRVTDSAGNSSTTASQAITIDTVDPTAVVSIVSITNDTDTPGDFITSDSNGLDVALSLTAALGTGEFIEYSIDGGITWLTSSVSGSGTSYTIANAPITTSLTLQVRVTDTAGNSSTTASQPITIDVPPLITANPSYDIEENSTGVLFNITVTNATSVTLVGDDGGLFSYDAATGDITVNTANLDWEALDDANKDGVYKVTVQAVGASTVTHDLEINLKDIAEVVAATSYTGGPEYVDALISNDGDFAHWDGGSAFNQGTNLTWGFNDTNALKMTGNRIGVVQTEVAAADIVSWTAAEKTYVRSVFDEIARVSGLTFTEVTTITSATSRLDVNMLLGKADSSDTGFGGVTNTLAYAFQPFGSTPKTQGGNVGISGDLLYSSGDVMMHTNKYQASEVTTEDSSFRSTFVHELLHAIGIDHPFNDAVSGAGFSPFSDTVDTGTNKLGVVTGGAHDSPNADNGMETRMTYHRAWGFGPSTGRTRLFEGDDLGTTDIAAIQHLYGANNVDATTSGDNTYIFDSATKVMQTLWDVGGNDTITHTGSEVAHINLNDGALSRVGLLPGSEYKFAWDDLGNLPGTKYVNVAWMTGGTGNGSIVVAPDGSFFTVSLNPEVGGFNGTFKFVVQTDTGTFTNVGFTNTYSSASTESAFNLGIAHGVTIENATGGDANDIIIGNETTNRITGGKGDDTLTGGDGGDVFIFDAGDGVDTITDYVQGEDILNFATGLTALGGGGVAVVGSDTVIDLGSSQTVTLTGYTGGLTAGTDYFFV